MRQGGRHADIMDALKDYKASNPFRFRQTYELYRDEAERYLGAKETTCRTVPRILSRAGPSKSNNRASFAISFLLSVSGTPVAATISEWRVARSRQRPKCKMQRFGMPVG